MSSSIFGTSSHSIRTFVGLLWEIVTGTRSPGIRYLSRVMPRDDVTHTGRIPGALATSQVSHVHQR